MTSMPARFRSVFESEFKAPETPPSHGLTGFVAIEVVAENADLRKAGGGCETGCWAAAMQGAPDEMPPPCKRPMKPGLRAALMPDDAQSRAAGTKCEADAARMRAFSLSFRSQFKAQKMPPSHGLTGLGVIKPGANQQAATGRAHLRAGLGWAGLGWATQQSGARPDSSRQGPPCRSSALESGANPRPPKRLHRTV